jgi:phospholipase C
VFGGELRSASASIADSAAQDVGLSRTRGPYASWASPIIEEAYAGIGFAAKHRAHCAVHAREPFVRQLFRHPLWRQRFRRHATQSAAGIPTARLGTVTDWRRSHRLQQPKQYTLPFRLDTQRGPGISGQCINDPDHSWIGMRAAWNLGANNNWLPDSIRCAPRDGTSASAGTGPISPTSSLLRVETPPRLQLSRG